MKSGSVKSKTETEIIIPHFTGMPLNKARILIEKIGLTLGEISYKESEYPRNTVLSQNIEADTKVNEKSAINLTVSNVNPIRYLPSMFQSNDSKNNGFLKRYLWIFQHIFESISMKLDDIHECFNPMKANIDFFHWLASWFSIDLNYSLPENKMRLLVKNAVNLYQWRGTSIGLAKFLEIITDVRPEIIEDYMPVSEYSIIDNKLVERPIIEKDTSLYKFTVSFPVKADHFDLETIKKIDQIIKQEKPVHANYHIVFAPKKAETKKPKFIIGDMITGEI